MNRNKKWKQPEEQVIEVWTKDSDLRVRLYELCVKYPEEFILISDEGEDRLRFLVTEEMLNKYQGEWIMSKKRKPSEKRGHHEIVAPYYKPVMYALRLFRSGKHMSDACYIARMFFTNSKCPDYIPPEQFNSKEFRRQIRKWINAD